MRGKRGPALRNLGAYLETTLQERWQAFLRQLSLCRKQCTEPAVHDLRVATRRLIAALDLLAAVIPERQVAKVKEQLRRILKSMGPLRDTQVQLLAVRDLLARFPELEPYCTLLLMRELRSLRQIARRLRKVHPAALRVQLRTATRAFHRLLTTAGSHHAIDLALRGALAGAFARVAASRTQIVRDDPQTIHKMRVSFKKFRYTVEMVRLHLNGALHKSMNAYQTRLGDIHDTEVLIAGITSFSREYPVPGSLMRVRRYLRAQLGRKTESLMRSMNEFRAFYHESN
jgi:CHAD domain-containing protein